MNLLEPHAPNEHASRGVGRPRKSKGEDRLNQDLAGKVVAITGAASGIGLACAKTCLIAGARVVLVDQAEDKLRQICSELGPAAIPLRINLTEAEQRCWHDAANPGEGRTTRCLPRECGLLCRGRRVRRRSRRLGPHAQPEYQCRVPIHSCGSPSYGRAQDRRHHRHQLGRGSCARCLGADLHGVETRRSSLRPHAQAPTRQARYPRRRSLPRPGRDGPSQGLAQGESGESLGGRAA